MDHILQIDQRPHTDETTNYRMNNLTHFTRVKFCTNVFHHRLKKLLALGILLGSIMDM